MKASRRTKTLAVVWVVATAIMAILTDQNDWSSTPLVIVSILTFLILTSPQYLKYKKAPKTLTP